MKPGNLVILLRCQIRRQTRDEDSILRTSSPSVCDFFVRIFVYVCCVKKERNLIYGKKTVYF